MERGSSPTAVGLLGVAFAAAAVAACGGAHRVAGEAGESRIAFTGSSRGPWGTWLVAPDGSGLAKLSAPYRRTRRTDLRPAWSPDGTRIAFRAYLERDALSGGAAYHVHVMDADGSGVRNLTRRHFREAGDFDWSPNGSRIVVDVWNERIDRHRLHVLRLGGAPPRLLTRGDDYAPRWSPDGSTIAFHRFARGGATGLWAIAADGTGLRRPAARAAGPAWSPDGTPLAYFRGRRPFTIYLADPDGGARIRLAEQPGEPGQLVWSPNGSAIAYDVYHPGRGRDIHVVDSDRGRRARLTRGRGDEVSPIWSPDGARIAYEASPVGGNVDNTGTYDVYVMNANGTGRHRLTCCRLAMGAGLSWQPAGGP